MARPLRTKCEQFDCDLVCATHYTETNFLSMINKSLSSEKRQALVKVLAKHATVFDFAQNEEQTSVPDSRTRHVIDTGSAHPIRQKPYSSAERKVIAEQVEEMLKKRSSKNHVALGLPL